MWDGKLKKMIWLFKSLIIHCQLEDNILSLFTKLHKVPKKKNKFIKISEGEHSLHKFLPSIDRHLNQPYAKNFSRWQKMRNFNASKNVDDIATSNLIIAKILLRQSL